MSSKSKRRVTVDTGNTVSEESEKRKPSVFERLGPGAGQRKYADYESEREKKCRPFLLNGVCPFGPTCKYKHVQLSRKSKSKEDDLSPENLKLKLKSGQSDKSVDKRRGSDAESPSHSASRSRRDRELEAGDRQDHSSSHSRRDKETKIKSQVVVKKSSGNQDTDGSGEDSDSNWYKSLDYKKELELEQQRQQLQRELSQLAEEEVDITVPKKVPPVLSGSDSSPERGRSSKTAPSPHDKQATSPGGRAKKEKKKHRARSPPETPVKDKKLLSPGPDKTREHKRKHDTEEDGHRKHKKKKEKKRSVTPPTDVKVKKKEKGVEDVDIASRMILDTGVTGRQHSQSHGKHPRSSSSNSSVSPPRPKDSKGKSKSKKKKSRGGKGDAGSGSDDSPTKSKKWLSPLKKTLKLKKNKPTVSAGDIKDEDATPKRQPPSPQASLRSNRDLLPEDPLVSLLVNDIYSSEKREKKHKGKRSESPALQADRSGNSKRADGLREGIFDRRGRQSESPALQPERGSSSKRGNGNRDPSHDRRKWNQMPGERDERKSGADNRQKHVVSSPRQSELYSPSQLDRESPIVELPQKPSRRSGRADRDLQREDDRQVQPRENRHEEKLDSHPQTPPRDLAGQDRYNRRSDGDTFDQFGQERGRFDPDLGRGEFRDGRGQEIGGERDERGRRMEHFERGQRDRIRTDGGMGRDSNFDRQNNARSTSGRDSSRDVVGRDRSRETTRERGESRDGRDRDGRAAVNEGRPFREDGREAGRAIERRGRDLPVDVRPPVEDQRIGRGENRMDRNDGRLDRGDSRTDRRDNRLDRGDSRPDRVDNRIEGRVERTEILMERGDNRMDRGDRSVDRIEGRLERGDNRVDRGERSEIRVDRLREDQPGGNIDQRSSRPGRGGGATGPVDGRGALRGLDSRSLVDSRGFDFERRGNGLRDTSGTRSGERDGRVDRDREITGAGGLPPRDRFDPAVEFRRDDHGFRSDIPEASTLRDRHVDDRYIGPEIRDPQLRSGRRFDDSRDDRIQSRGQIDDRQGRDRMLPRRGVPYDFDPTAEVRMQDLPLSQRRGPLLPTPIEELPRFGGRGDVYDREIPRAGREGARDGRDDRERRDLRDADFGPELCRDDRLRTDQREVDFGPELARVGRDFSRDSTSDLLWERDINKDNRDLGRETVRDIPRDQQGRRNRASTAENIPLDVDRNRERNRPDSQRRDRERSPRRDLDKSKDNASQETDTGKRHSDKRDDMDKSIHEKLDTSDARSTRSADDVRASTSQRLKKDGGDTASKGNLLKGLRDRDSQSDGKRSPARSRGKDRSPTSISERRQPKRARSLSPKQRQLTPPASASATGESERSLAKPRSPGRRGVDSVPSPLPKVDRRARSRTPVGMKRKGEEDLRSKSKDETKSPTSKKLREESRSPGRKGSRHPSPAGSHHSHSSLEPRRRPGSAHRDAEGRFFGQSRDGDSPAWRDKDHTSKMEKPGDNGKGDDKGEVSRKRGRSPSRSQGRGSDGADWGRKRWRGEKWHPSVERAYQAGFEPAEIENKLSKMADESKQRMLCLQTRNLAAQKVVLDKRYDRERLLCKSEDLLILYDCKRQSILDWFIRRDRRQLMHFEEDAENCVDLWLPISNEKYQAICCMLSKNIAILASALRYFLDGSWSDADGCDNTDKDGFRQKLTSSDQGRASDNLGEPADAGRLDMTKASHAFSHSTAAAASGPADGGKMNCGADNMELSGSEAREVNDGHPSLGDSRAKVSNGDFHGDSSEDIKDTSLKNMLRDDDYEKISSDESDFEADDGDKQTQNIVTELDIDWASLAKEATPKQTTGSLLKRFHPATIFSQIGVSRSLAGAALFDKVKSLCQEGVKVEDAQDKSSKETTDTTAENKSRENTPVSNGELDTALHSSVPVMHMAFVRQKRDRANLLRNLGPFRKALCARRDLEIRRQLCKVDKVYEQPAVFPSHVMDTDLCKLSIQLFRQGRDFVDRKDSECDSKIELVV